MEKDIFAQLFEVLLERKTADAETSYTAKLMKKGVSKINEKISEEAAEVCEAALEDDKEHLTYEICDLFYHTLVLAAYKDISLDGIKNEFGRRFGVSGIAEKESRSKK